MIRALRDPELTPEERAMAAGEQGEALALAMRVVAGLARVSGAARLQPVESAHIDGCLYHGRAGLDFAERLVALGGSVRVRATLNVGSLDLLHPGLVRAGPELARAGRALMDAYVALGCEPTWSCAPYQLSHRPGFGTHVAWAESNAIAFVNSVLGARTDRYGDFLDIAAALTGRVPYAGLHLDANRRASLVLDCSAVPRALFEHDAAWPALGHLLGCVAGTRVAALAGVPAEAADEDRLKALGATAASAGGVALFHVVGTTPEAPSLEAVAGGDAEVVAVGAAALRRSRDALTTARDDRLDAVSLGTPHFSVAEFERLAAAVGDGAAFAVDVWVSTSRAVLEEVRRRGLLAGIEAAGARILVDTCTYVTPVLAPGTRAVMTSSGKWAWYAPANLGLDVVLGSLDECVASARAGRVVRDERPWS